MENESPNLENEILKLEIKAGEQPSSAEKKVVTADADSSKRGWAATWNICKIVFLGIYRFCEKMPAYYQTTASWFQKTIGFAKKHSRMARQTAKVFLAAIVILGIYLIYQYRYSQWMDEKVVSALIMGDRLLASGNYSLSEKAYKEALELAGAKSSSFMQERYRLTSYLSQIYLGIRQGQSQSVQELLATVRKERWDGKIQNVFEAYFEALRPEINRLESYEESIQQVVASLKNAKREEAENILQKTLRLSREYNTSLKPLKERLLDGIRHEYSDMLLISWKYQEKLGITHEEINAVLGKNSAEKIDRSEKLLHKDSLEVAEVLAALLNRHERERLAERYQAFHGENTRKEVQERNIATALILNPAFSEAYFQNAALNEASGEYEKAIESYKKANDSYLARVLSNEGWTYFLQHKFPLAVKDWQRAVRIVEDWQSSTKNRPEFPQAHLGLGIFYFLLQNYDKSLYHINKATPGGIHAAKIIKQIVENKPGIIEEIEKIEGVVRGYVYLCHAIHLFYSTNNSDGSLASLVKAQEILQNHRVIPLEPLVYKAIVYEKMQNVSALKQSMEELAKYNEYQESRSFLSLLYFQSKDKEMENILSQMPVEWKVFWEESRSSQK